MRRILLLAALWATPGLAVPLSTIGTFCSTFPDECRRGTESLLAARGIGTNAYYVLEVDPTTGGIPVTASVTIPANGATGSAVPAQADYQGLNNGGTLIGAIGDSAGRTIVAGGGTAGTPAGGVLTVQGVTSMTALKVDGSATTQPVSGTVTASNFPATVDTNQGTPGASTLRAILAGRPIASSIVASNAYASTNVTTGAYVQLIAATANAINNVCISNSSGSIIKVATGAGASEVDRIYLPAGGAGCYTALNIPASTRISLEALDQTAATGYFLFTGY